MSTQFNENNHSLVDQMYALRFLSNHAGLQDASTWLRRWCQDRPIADSELCRQFYPHIDQADQVQYSTTQQMNEVVAMAKRFGLMKAAHQIHKLLGAQATVDLG